MELSKTEQKLLRLLVENRGRTMTRGDLVDRVWTDGAEYVDENALSVTIKRLRDKLGAQKYIKTVYGIGYSWVTKMNKTGIVIILLCFWRRQLLCYGSGERPEKRWKKSKECWTLP